MALGSRKRASGASDRSSVINGEHSQSKRTKINASRSAGTSAPRHQGRASDLRKVDTNGDVYWEVSKLRRVTISSFRGKTLVNIREYYGKDGQELPGKKGISLPMDQFASLIALLPDIELALKDLGVSVPRPDYAGKGSILDEDNDEREEISSGGGLEGSRMPRKNIEATSEEDESEE
ncbi:hypothetical protein BBP40_009678 [Aspergillus hancockii]|nr:hypothetical protein BBP40_009678 [Aspergillus hancockii]